MMEDVIFLSFPFALLFPRTLSPALLLMLLYHNDRQGLIVSAESTASVYSANFTESQILGHGP